MARPMGREGWVGGGTVGGGGGVGTDTVKWTRVGAAGARVTRRADRVARRVTDVRARVRRVRAFLDTVRLALDFFLETAPNKGIATNKIQSVPDISLPISPYGVVGVAGEAGGVGSTGGGGAGTVGLTVFFFLGAAFLAVFFGAAFLVAFLAAFLGAARNKGVARDSKVSNNSLIVTSV